jgi:hypothetical protein
VETVGDVATIKEIGEFQDLLGIPAKVLHRIRLRALSYISGGVIQTEPVEFPSDKLVYIDIETDERCSRVWLIGAFFTYAHHMCGIYYFWELVGELFAFLYKALVLGNYLVIVLSTELPEGYKLQSSISSACAYLDLRKV